MKLFNIREKFNKPLAHENFILFIRHAEKEIKLNHQHDNEICLTLAGQKAAYALGQEIKKFIPTVQKIKTSPVNRCIQTAAALQQSIDPLLPIEYSCLLGGPGAYIENADLAGSNFEQHSLYDILSYQQQGKILPGMMALHTGTQRLSDEIQRDFMLMTSPIIYITHDIVLASFIVSYYPNIIFNEENWIDYLSGCYIFKKDESLTIQL